MTMIRFHLLIYILVFLCSFAVKDTVYMALNQVKGHPPILVYSVYTLVLICIVMVYRERTGEYFRGDYLSGKVDRAQKEN